MQTARLQLWQCLRRQQVDEVQRRSGIGREPRTDEKDRVNNVLVYPNLRKNLFVSVASMS